MPNDIKDLPSFELIATLVAYDRYKGLMVCLADSAETA